MKQSQGLKIAYLCFRKLCNHWHLGGHDINLGRASQSKTPVAAKLIAADALSRPIIPNSKHNKEN